MKEFHLAVVGELMEAGEALSSKELKKRLREAGKLEGEFPTRQMDSLLEKLWKEGKVQKASDTPTQLWYAKKPNLTHNGVPLRYCYTST